MAGKLFNERRDEGDYVVRRPDSERASATESTQAEAIERAREIDPDTLFKSSALGTPKKEVGTCAFIARFNRSFIEISPIQVDNPLHSGFALVAIHLVIAETCRRTSASRSLTVPAWPRPESRPSAR